MSAKLMPALHFKAVDANTGAALTGGKVYFYLAGTSTPKTAYAAADGVTAISNPVDLDSNGEAQIWLGAGYYRIVVTDINGVVMIDEDNVSAYSENVSGIVAIANGGTGVATKAAGFDALSPLTTAGDVLYGGVNGTGTRLGKGTANQVLHSGSVPSFSAIDLAADVSGILPVANGGTGVATRIAAAYAVDGAISEKEGFVMLTKVGVNAMTLAGPTAPDDNGKVLRIVATTAFAHTVTNGGSGFNSGGAASDVATFGGAIGDNLQLVAYQGVWLVLSKLNVVLA